MANFAGRHQIEIDLADHAPPGRRTVSRARVTGRPGYISSRASRPLRSPGHDFHRSQPEPLHLRADPFAVPHHDDDGALRADVRPGRGARGLYADGPDPVACRVMVVIGELEDDELRESARHVGGGLHPEGEDPREVVSRASELLGGRPLITEPAEDGDRLAERRRRDPGLDRCADDERTPVPMEVEARAGPVGEAVLLAEAQVQPAREGPAEDSVRDPERHLVRMPPGDRDVSDTDLRLNGPGPVDDDDAAGRDGPCGADRGRSARVRPPPVAEVAGREILDPVRRELPSHGEAGLAGLVARRRETDERVPVESRHRGLVARERAPVRVADREQAAGKLVVGGLLTSPLRARFGIVHRLDYYSSDNLREIVSRSARIMGVPIDDVATNEIARRARGTPRVANRLLRRVRDFAEVRADGVITVDVAHDAMKMLEVDDNGFDEADRRLLKTIIDKFGGGPVGLNSLAAAISEEKEAIEDIYEPFLIQCGFLDRTPRGRVATPRAYEYFGVTAPERSPGLW